MTSVGSRRNQRTAVPSPPRGTIPIQPSVPGSHPKGTGSPRNPLTRAVGDSMNTTWWAVTAMSCCQVARSSSTACAVCSAPVASHSPIRNRMPSDSSGPASSSSRVPSSTEKSTRAPSAATLCTCDAIGTVSAPENSSGSKKRE